MAEYSDPGYGPGNAPRSRHVTPVAAAAALLWHVVFAYLTSVPASAKESRVIGCWDRELTDPSRNNRVNICFDPDGQLTGFYLEATGEAGDITGVWRLQHDRERRVTACAAITSFSDWAVAPSNYASRRQSACARAAATFSGLAISWRKRAKFTWWPQRSNTPGARETCPVANQLRSAAVERRSTASARCVMAEFATRAAAADAASRA
jgi:hypothetical protein